MAENSNPFTRLEELLSSGLAEIRFQISQLKNAKPDLPEIGGVELAIRITGLSRSSIYRLVCHRKIPHLKKGKRLYFKREELTSWIEEGRRNIFNNLNLNG